jgi:phospholipid/cholesterol/gamma-HCH transport system permease protein
MPISANPIHTVRETGRAGMGAYHWARNAVEGAGDVAMLLLHTAQRLNHRSFTKTRIKDTIYQMYAGGVLAIPIVMMVSLFMGMVLALQTGIELGKFGQQDLIGSIVSVAMCREMGPLITGIILVAAVGSAMAAELGTMSVSEELTALDVMTVDRVRFLVLPRVFALAVMCPILTIISDVIGIVGGEIIAVERLGVSPPLYITTTMDALRGQSLLGLPRDIYVGVLKSFVFGIVIAGVACSTGMRATNGAQGVGDATRRAVRTTILLIVVLNYILTGMFFGLIPE